MTTTAIEVNITDLYDTALDIREDADLAKAFREALADLVESAGQHEPVPAFAEGTWFCIRCGFNPTETPCDTWTNVSLLVQAYREKDNKSGDDEDAAPSDHRGAEGSADGSGAGPDGGDAPGESA